MPKVIKLYKKETNLPKRVVKDYIEPKEVVKIIERNEMNRELLKTKEPEDYR